MDFLEILKEAFWIVINIYKSCWWILVPSILLATTLWTLADIYSNHKKLRLAFFIIIGFMVMAYFIGMSFAVFISAIGIHG